MYLYNSNVLPLKQDCYNYFVFFFAEVFVPRHLNNFFYCRFIYQVLIGKCLREALVENFGEESDMVEIGQDGCGCDSCEVTSREKIDEQRNLLLLLKAIDDLKQTDRSEKKVCFGLHYGLSL